jgi:peptidoglycan/xylan/chitin deacetylase (PgdA/CDA1 family)
MASRLSLLRPLLAGLAILLAIFGVCAAVLLLAPNGANRAARASVPEAAPGRDTGAERSLPVTAGPSPPVENQPETFGEIPAFRQREMGGQGPHDLMRGSPSLPYICLTFDGDAQAGDVPHILQVLAGRSVQATFFLTGEFCRRHPKETRAIVQAGHEVGNHLLEHVHLTTWGETGHQDVRPGIDREVLQRLLLGNEAAFQEVTGHTMQKLWRAPYGETNAELDGWAAELGYIHVSWTRDFSGTPSMDSLDWVADPAEPRYLTVRQIRDRLLSFDGGRPGGANGAIILMHAGTIRRGEHAWTVLGEVVDGLRQRGYTFVTVSRLIRESLRPESRPSGNMDRAAKR